MPGLDLSLRVSRLRGSGISCNKICTCSHNRHSYCDMKTRHYATHTCLRAFDIHQKKISNINRSLPQPLRTPKIIPLSLESEIQEVRRICRHSSRPIVRFAAASGLSPGGRPYYWFKPPKNELVYHHSNMPPKRNPHRVKGIFLLWPMLPRFPVSK